MTLHGRVKSGVIVLDKGDVLADGTLVRVSPLQYGEGDPLAVIAAMESEPHLSQEDIAEFNRVVAAGKRPAAPIEPFALESE